MEEGMATHSSILAWKIPRAEEPGGLQSVGSQWVRQGWATNTRTAHKVSVKTIIALSFSHSVTCSFCDPMDCSPPGSSVHGILQARILEWAAMPSSRGISPTQGSNLPLLYGQADSLPLSLQGSLAVLGLVIFCIFFWVGIRGHFIHNYRGCTSCQVTEKPWSRVPPGSERGHWPNPA